MKHWFTVLLVIGVSVPGLSAGADDEPGFVPFPQATLERRSSVEEKDSRVFLGAVSEVNNQLRVGKEIRKSWSGLTRMFRVGRDYSVGEVADYYRSRINEKEATVLFECTGRSCGNSNVWANRVFGESRLYGRDDTQVYLVTAWPDVKNRLQLNTLYLIERGNREVYVYEQAFHLDQDERLPGVELKERRVFGPAVIRWSNPDSPRLEASEADYDRVMSLADEYQDGTLYLLGFSPLEDSSLDSVMTQTEGAARLLRDKLTDRGLSSDRIRIRTLGPLVRTAEPGRSGRRVEVMLVRERSDD